MTKEEAIERLQRIDIKYFITGRMEQSNYIIDEADKTNEAIETVLSTLEEQEYKIKQCRRKWKHRYYKMKNKNKDLQKSVEQIYDDYQDIGKMAFNYSDKIEEQDKIIDLMAEQLTTPIHGKKWIKQYFENKAKESE